MRQVFGYIGEERKEYILEIYNEQIDDLLAPPSAPNKVEIHGASAGDVILTPLGEDVITIIKGIRDVLKRGESYRRTTCTDWGSEEATSDKERESRYTNKRYAFVPPIKARIDRVFSFRQRCKGENMHTLKFYRSSSVIPLTATTFPSLPRLQTNASPCTLAIRERYIINPNPSEFVLFANFISTKLQLL